MKLLTLFLLFLSVVTYSCKAQSHILNGCWTGRHGNINYLVMIEGDSLMIMENQTKKHYKIKKKEKHYTFEYSPEDKLVIRIDNHELNFAYNDKKLRVSIPLIVEVVFAQCEK
ncbi:MAG: hypothetical protein ABIV51_02875 [Saprospiraceae bacterium]